MSRAVSASSRASVDGSTRSKNRMLAAESDVKQAELDMRKNPILPAIVRRQNELALEAAKDRLRQAQRVTKLVDQSPPDGRRADQRLIFRKARYGSVLAQRARKPVAPR